MLSRWEYVLSQPLSSQIIYITELYEKQYLLDRHFQNNNGLIIQCELRCEIEIRLVAKDISLFTLQLFIAQVFLQIFYVVSNDGKTFIFRFIEQYKNISIVRLNEY